MLQSDYIRELADRAYTDGTTHAETCLAIGRVWPAPTVRACSTAQSRIQAVQSAYIAGYTDTINATHNRAILASYANE